MADARDTLAAMLRPYGLDAQDVLNATWTFVQENPNLADNTDLLLSSARNTKTYQDRFAGNAERVRKGLSELSPKAYLEYEEAYRQSLRRAGMPVGFYDSQQDFAKFVANDVDPAELTLRLERGYRAVTQADPQIVAELKRLYSVDDASLAAFFIDPEKARDIVIRQAEAAQISAAANRQAQITLTTQEAERLSQQGLSPEEAQQQFAALGQTKELFQPLTEGEQAITREEQLSAVGGNAAAAQRIATRRRQRQAEFEAGGGLAETKEGITGLRTVGQ